MSRLVSLYAPIVFVALSLISVGCGGDSTSKPRLDAGGETGKVDAMAGGSPDTAPLETGNADVQAALDVQATGEVAQTFDVAAKDAAVADGASADLADAASLPQPDMATGSADVQSGNDAASDLPRVDSSSPDSATLDTVVALDTVSGDLATTAQKLGNVIVQEASMSLSVAGTSMTIISSTAVGAFGLVPGDSECPPSATVGVCKLYECSSTGNTTENYLNAGTVTVSGFATDLVLNFPAAGNTYMSTTSTDWLWTSSRPITLNVSGSADVPAYSLSLTAPNPIAVTSPLPQGVDTSGFPNYPLSRATNLVLTWTGGVEGTVLVDMTSGSTATPAYIICEAAATTGTLTVPAAFMAKLSGTVGLDVSVSNYSWKTVGDWTMGFQAAVSKNHGTVTFAD
jgi:hypothetical protein